MIYLCNEHVITEIKRHELNQDNVVIYFVGLKNEESCVTFDIAEDQKVENRTASTVNVFDYYKPEDRATFVSVCITFVFFATLNAF